MKLTIATPTFGKPKYLKENVKSICHQTLSTSQIICGANLSLNEKFDELDVKIINHSVDPGMVVCWSTAASLAKSEYIGFLADDNSFQPKFAERLVNFLEENPGCDMVFCNQYVMDEYGEIDLGKSENFTRQFGRNLLPSGVIEERYFATILDKGSLPLEGCIIKKKIWDLHGPFKIEARGSFDHEFMYRLLLKGVRIGFIPEYLMNFRLHSGAYTSRAKKDHLLGTIWSYESLGGQSKKDYRDIFKTKGDYLKGRLLRYKIPLKDRVALMKTLARQKKGLGYIFKNSLMGMVGYIFPLKK